MADQKTPAAIAAEAIEADILDRRGLKWELRQCDPAIRKQIRAAWTAIIAQATLDACEQAAPRVRAEERARIVRAVDRLAPPCFQPGAIGRYVRSVVARATDLPIETAAERGLAVNAARAEGVAEGLRMAAAEAREREAKAAEDLADELRDREETGDYSDTDEAWDTAQRTEARTCAALAAWCEQAAAKGET